MLQIVLPVLYYIPGDQNHHSYENSLDALLMMKNDAKLLIMSGLFIKFVQAVKSPRKFARSLKSPFKMKTILLLIFTSIP